MRLIQVGSIPLVGCLDQWAAWATARPTNKSSLPTGAVKFPYMVPENKSYPGVEIGEQAAKFWSEGDGTKIPIFMAIGMKDLVIEPKGWF